MRRLAAFLITLALVGMPVTWAWADPKPDPGPSPSPSPSTDQQPSEASVAPPSGAASSPTEPAVPAVVSPPIEPVPTPTWPGLPGLDLPGLLGHLNLPQASHKPNDNWVHTFLLKPHLSAPTEFLSIATHNIPSSNCAGVRQSRRAAPNGGRASRASSHVSC